MLMKTTPHNGRAQHVAAVALAVPLFGVALGFAASLDAQVEADAVAAAALQEQREADLDATVAAAYRAGVEAGESICRALQEPAVALMARVEGAQR